MKKYLLWNIIGFGLSVTLQLAGILTPGWWITKSKFLGKRYEVGVWYILDCDIKMNSCKLESRELFFLNTQA